MARLATDILSKPHKTSFTQIETLLPKKAFKKVKTGQTEKIENIGKISIKFFCKECVNEVTFLSEEKFVCVCITESTLSIDSVLACPSCSNALVKVWFLVENKDNNNIFETLPSVRVAQYRYSLSPNVSAVNNEVYGDYSNLFDKAEVAYRDGLGAGAIIYLRIVFEKILHAVASELKIKTTKEDGKSVGTKNILLEIEKNIKIMPEVFANDGYKLFEELSNVIHVNNDEELALQKYEACKSLVTGVLEKIKNDKQYLSDCKLLGM